MSKVYTKTGDKGTTSLIGGTRVKKSDIRINSYGTVDELNSFVGLLATYIKEEETIELLAEMQNVLFNIGCNLAMGDNFKKEIKESVVTTKLIENVEHAIDRMQAAIPELKHFVIPGGSRSASIAHVCRTVCRRAERLIISLDETSEVDKNLMAYINRLSDYFFVLSRYLNNIENVKFFVGKAEEIITGEYENGNIRDIDVIVVDPPRKGLDKLAIDTMLKLLPKRIVYVSCDSSTLARDLKLLCEKEYELKKLTVVDQFARSYHTESVVVMSRDI